MHVSVLRTGRGSLQFRTFRLHFRVPACVQMRLFQFIGTAVGSGSRASVMEVQDVLDTNIGALTIRIGFWGAMIL